MFLSTNTACAIVLCGFALVALGKNAEPLKPGDTLPSKMFGFYIHIYDMPAAVIRQVEMIEEFFPDSPIYIMSDGGIGMEGLCKKHKCTFKMCPPANDRWNPWPFLRRMWDAAVALDTEYMVMLEPDNMIQRAFIQDPPTDAGGLDDANPHLHYETVAYAEYLAREKAGKKDFRWKNTASGLAGGSYFRTAAVIDAFSDAAVADINWTWAECFESKRLYSSDFGMPMVLSARGFSYEPWRDITQYDLDCCTKIRQPRDAALQHYGRGVTGGKPMYNIKLLPEQSDLWEPMNDHNKNTKVTCQGCYDRDEYYKTHGSLDCTNRLVEKAPWDLMGGRRCGPEEKAEGVAFLEQYFGGKDALKQLYVDHKGWEEAELQERRKRVQIADEILDAYNAATKRSPPPTPPVDRMHREGYDP